MSQVVRKYQSGSSIQDKDPKKRQLQFKVNGQLRSVDEEEWDAGYNDFLKGLGGHGKNQSEWDAENVRLKEDILKGQESGEYFDFDLAGDRAQQLTTDMDLTNEQLGLTEKGRVARPGLFSRLTGVKKPATMRAMLYDNIGRRLARSEKERDERLAEEATRKEQEDKARSDQELSTFYTRARNAFDMGNTLYGPQIYNDNTGQFTYNRFHENPDNQRSDLVNYFRSLGNYLNDSRFDNDTLKSKFNQDFPFDIAAARKLLSEANLDDPNTDLGSLANQLGLGTQYQRLTDRKYYDAQQKQKELDAQNASKRRDPAGQLLSGWSENKHWTNGELTKRGTDEEGRLIIDGQVVNDTVIDNVFYRQGKPSSGMFNNLEYGADGKPRTELGAFDEDTNFSNVGDTPLWVGGKKLNVNNFLASPNNSKLYPNLWTTVTQSLSEVYDRTTPSNWINVGDKAFTSKSKSVVPFLNGQPAPDVEAYHDYTHMFSDFGSNDGKVNNAIIAEKLKVIDPLTGKNKIRFKLIGKNINGQTTEITGKIRRSKNGTGYVFQPDDPSMPAKNLGQMNASATGGDASLNDNLVYLYNNEQPLNTGSGRSLRRLPGYDSGGVIKAQLGAALSGDTRGGNVAGDVDLFGGITDKDYKLSTNDNIQLGALAADLAGLGATFFGGPVGNVIGAGTGAAGSVAHAVASANRGEDWGWNLAGNIALDAASLIPIVGTGAKAAKIAKTLKNIGPWLGAALAGAGLVQAKDSVTNILNGKATTRDWSNLLSGVTALRYGKRAALDKRMATTKGPRTGTVTVNVGNEAKSLKLDPNDLKRFESLKDADSKADFVKKLAIDKGMGKAEDIVVDTKAGGWNRALNWWKPDVQGFGTTSSRRLKTPEELNWFSRRAQKRYLSFNPNERPPITTNPNRLLPAASGEPTTNTLPWATNGQVRPRGWNTEINNATRPTITPVETARAKNLNKGRKSGARKEAQERTLAGIEKTQMKPRVIGKEGEFDVQMPPSSRWNAPQYSTWNAPRTEAPSVNFLDARANYDTKVREQIQSALAKQKAVVSAKSGTKPTRDNVKATSKAKGYTGGFRKGKYAEGGIIKAQQGATINYLPIGIDKEMRNSVPYLNNRPILQRPIFKTSTGTATQPVWTSSPILNFNSLGRMYGPVIPGSPQIASPISNTVNTTTFNSAIPNKRRASVPSVNIPKVDVAPAGRLTNVASAPLLANLASKLTTSGGGLSAPGSGLKSTPNRIAGSDAIVNTEGLARAANAIDTADTEELTGYGSPLTNDTSTGTSRGLRINPTTLSELGRTIFNIATTKNVDTRVEAPMLSHVQEIVPAVKGDYLTQNAYSRAANRLTQQAGQPFTSDSAVQLAGQLATNAKAAELNTQGAMANAQALRQQEAMQTDALRNYAGGRQNISNINRQTLAQRDQAERGLRNEKNLAMAKSIDNFWANENQRAYMEQERNRYLTDQIRGIEAQNATFANDYTLAEYAGKTPLEARADIGAKMQAIYNLENPSQQDRQQLEALRTKAAQIENDARLLQLNAMLNQSDPNSVQLFNFDWLRRRRPSTTAATVVQRRKGGSLSKSDRIEIEAFKSNEKSRRDWYRDYNKWLSTKMNNDTKQAIAAGKDINEIVKLALGNKK